VRYKKSNYKINSLVITYYIIYRWYLCMTIINIYYIICMIVRGLDDTSQCRRCKYSNGINENTKDPRRRMINDSR